MNYEKMDNPVLRIMSIFNLLRMNALTLQGQATGELEAFCGDCINMSEVGMDEANKIWAEVSDKDEAETKTLAEQISEILKNPDIPTELYDAMRVALNDVFNSHIDQSEITEYETSPEFIEMILRGIKKKTGGGK